MSVRRIAKMAGISAAAVSMALRGNPRISESTRRRVQTLARRLGYHPNSRIGELMSHVRASGQRGTQSCFGVVSFYDTPRPWERSLQLARIYEGMMQRARALGYRLEPFWLRAPGMTYRRFSAILDARGIEGLLCFGSPNLEEDFPSELDRTAIVTVGLSIRTPLHRVTQHAYNDMFRALNKVHKLGYRRPGLAIGRYEEDRSAHSYVSAYLGWCEHTVGTAATIPPLRLQQVEQEPLHAWLESYRPDVLILAHVYDKLPEFTAALRLLGVRVGRDLGVAAISQMLQGTGLAGLQENQHLMGAWAVELLTARIMNRDFGIPKQPRIEMVESQWVHGPSLRAR